MRESNPRIVRRIVAGLLFAALCAPIPIRAADDPPPQGEVAPAEDSELETPAPVERHWYQPLLRNLDIGVDLLLIRPLAGVTAGVGAVLFVPAVIMTAPNGKDSIKDCYERFLREPGEYFVTRPLGEF